MHTSIAYLVLAFASMFCFGLLDNSRGPAYPYILELFGLSNAGGSNLFAVSSAASLVALVFGRLWLKRFGELVSQRILLVMVMASAFCIGLSQFIGGFPLLIASSFVFGLGMGGTALTCNLLVAYGSAERTRRRIYSGLHSMYGISSVIAPSIFGIAMKGGGMTWGMAFMVLAASALVPLSVSAFTKPVAHGLDSTEKPAGIGRWMRLKVGLTLSLYVMSEIAISTRLVLYATRHLAIDPADAAFYLSLFFSLLLAGRFAFFVIPFKARTFTFMMASALSSLALLVLGVVVHPVFLAFSGLTMSIYFPCGMEWISERFGRNAGYMMASVMISVMSALVVMHWVIGIAADLVGLRLAMIVPVLTLALAIALLFSNRKEFN